MESGFAPTCDPNFWQSTSREYKTPETVYGFELNNNSIISATQTGPRQTLQTSTTGPWGSHTFLFFPFILSYLLDCFCVIKDLAKKHSQSISRVSSCPSILSNNQSHVSSMALLTYIWCLTDTELILLSPYLIMKGFADSVLFLGICLVLATFPLSSVERRSNLPTVR